MKTTGTLEAILAQLEADGVSPVPILPNAYDIRRAHAQDIAEQIVLALDSIGGTLCLYLTAAGEMAVDALGEVVKVEGARDYLTLVGCYNELATVAQIRDDILACQREAI